MTPTQPGVGLDERGVEPCGAVLVEQAHRRDVVPPR